MNTTTKVWIVMVGAIMLSTLALQASDLVRGIGGSLTASLIDSGAACGEQAVQVSFGSHVICMDIYEASPSKQCVYADPQNIFQTQQNIDAESCVGESKPGVTPWRHVTLTEAQQLCARSGKRLPNNAEWYKAVSGSTNLDACAVDTGQSEAGIAGATDCVSPAGIHDMVGNVWEWVEGQVVDGTYNDRTMPEAGYVSLVDTDGVVLETTSEVSLSFGSDYAWTNDTGVRGMIRGGHYGSKSDAGIYALSAAIPLDFRTAGIGFRCVRDL